MKDSVGVLRRGVGGRTGGVKPGKSGLGQDAEKRGKGAET